MPTDQENIDAADLHELNVASDMYDRLATTLDNSDISSTVIQSIVLQLAGAPARPRDVGEDIRGDIHLAIVSEDEVNLSRFLSAVGDIAPQETVRLNGTSTTLAGAIGSVSGGTLDPGPVLDDHTDLTIIENFDELDSSTQSAFQQTIDSGTYSFAKANYQGTVGASGSLLFAQSPRYGNFDGYEPVGEQLDLLPAIVGGVDLVLTNQRDITDNVSTSEDALPVEIAREYLKYARTIDPTLTAVTANHITTYLKEISGEIEDDAPYTPGLARLQETLIRFALAHARLRLADETEPQDAKRSIQLVKSVLGDIGIDPEREDSQRERIRTVKEVIKENSEGRHDGVPTEKVVEECVEMGFDREVVEDEIEKLRRQGDVYEPDDGIIAHV